MNRVIVSATLAFSFLLIACGNKGDLYLETNQAITEEIKQLDDSLGLTDDELPTDSETESATKKPAKKAGESS